MIAVLFNILFAFIPLLFWKNTSELFEFNKIVFLYGMTTLIMAVWLYKSIVNRKFIFRRTILDWPLFIYLSIYLISTLFSIDPRTSVLGYYSRFNGGLISQICYALLYWAFVSNMSAKQSLYAIRYTLFATAIASLLAVLEHFGIFATCGLMNLGWRNSCWVQDVQTRVFSTLGQPNWLAALLVALLPITFCKSKKYYLLSILFFITLLFTKSRSGLLAFGVESIIFWGFVFWKSKFKYLKEFLILNFIFLVLFFVFSKPITYHLSPITYQGPALEVGGTESGVIRKYVWLGAIEIFKKNPILGTGPETFAFSFPMYKPIGHNLTSEWDFVYNKAHNEFLNYLANTGILGFLSYLVLIGTSIFQIVKNSKLKKLEDSKQFKNKNSKFDNFILFGVFDFWSLGIFAGYISILITNFFGFSVVPVSLLFFLLPAFALEMNNEKLGISRTKISTRQIFSILFLLLVTCYLLLTIGKYWLADIHYNKARLFNKLGNAASAKQEITKSLKISPKEPLFLNELGIAENNPDQIKKAVLFSPYNINLLRSLAGVYSKNKNVQDAILTIETAIKLSPNDPKLYYQTGIYFIKLNDLNKAKVYLKKSVNLKPNYKDARFALGLTYIDLKEFDLAKKELKYILEFIDPKDELTKKYLNEI